MASDMVMELTMSMIKHDMTSMGIASTIKALSATPITQSITNCFPVIPISRLYLYLRSQFGRKQHSEDGNVAQVRDSAPP